MGPHTGSLCPNKKRKLKSEQLGMPQRKQKCRNQGIFFEFDLLSSTNLEAEELITFTSKIQVEVRKDDESEPELMNDSNIFSGDADSCMSVSCVPKNQNTCLCYQPSTSSAGWCVKCFKTDLNSPASSLTSEASIKERKLVDNMVVQSFSCPDFETFMGCEEHYLELEGHIHCEFPDCEENSELYAEKELEDFVFPGETEQNNYVLSSGRWNVNKETQADINNLTIDKEFEQYFSMLML